MIEKIAAVSLWMRRVIRSFHWLGIALLSQILTACFGSFALAQSCEGAVRTNLVFADLQPTVVQARPFGLWEFERYRQFIEQSSLSAYTHPLMLVTREIGGKHNAGPDTLGEFQTDSDAYCLKPLTAVLIFFGEIRRQVHLIDLAAEDICIRDALIEHDRLHIKAEMQIIQEFMKQNGASALDFLKAVKDSDFPQADQASLTFTRAADRLLDQWTAMLLEKGPAFLFPTRGDEDLDSLRQSCGGNLGRLEAKVEFDSLR